MKLENKTMDIFYIFLILIGLLIAITVSAFYFDFFNSSSSHSSSQSSSFLRMFSSNNNDNDETSGDSNEIWCMMMKLPEKNECVKVIDRQRCSSGQVFNTRDKCETAEHFGTGF